MLIFFGANIVSFVVCKLNVATTFLNVAATFLHSTVPVFRSNTCNKFSNFTKDVLIMIS